MEIVTRDKEKYNRKDIKRRRGLSGIPCIETKKSTTAKASNKDELNRTKHT